MGKKRARKGLQTLKAFKKTLREEVTISVEFDMPLAALALAVEGGWQEDNVRRASSTRHAADELRVALPNTRPVDSRVVEERLRGIV